MSEPQEDVLRLPKPDCIGLSKDRIWKVKHTQTKDFVRQANQKDESGHPTMEIVHWIQLARLKFTHTFFQ